MNKEELLKLVNAGFTKEEIFTLFGDKTEDTPETKEDTPKEDTPQELENFSGFPSNGLEVMTEGISKAIIEAIQKQNILNSSQREENPISSEDIIANVLNLYEKES